MKRIKSNLLPLFLDCRRRLSKIIRARLSNIRFSSVLRWISSYAVSKELEKMSIRLRIYGVMMASK